jgi:translation initiation factor 2B subunit (eIF-2B alpha/beta/delta family)/8-oxo-dGTP pyrophosphatase MutT (NUDIX family)
MPTSIKRVVSCFILSGTPTRENLRIAVFHRVETMPTFPSHWAACSGSIEEGEIPSQTALRELQEETNLPVVDLQGGLYLDVPFKSSRGGETIIRVYPFTVKLPLNWKLELLGTEHDSFQFVTVDALEALQPAVPGLAQAFHHATHGQYLPSAIMPAIRDWYTDKVNGAAVMARNAVKLVEAGSADAATLRMMRPSMVAITNALDSLVVQTPAQVLEDMQRDLERTVEYAVHVLQPLIAEHRQSHPESPFTVATHSRSSTILTVLRRTLHECKRGDVRIICGKSTPGDEGILMAQDLGDNVAECVQDNELLEMIRTNCVDALLTGCDCLTEKDVVNKIGTGDLARASASAKTQVFCCVDHWKQWNDIFPPLLEDIFECVPFDLFDAILMPPLSFDGSNQCKNA